MPRTPSGEYELPAGQPVVTDTIIESDVHNTFATDVAEALSDSLSRSGKGGMLVPFRVIDGTPADAGLGFINAYGTGLSRDDATGNLQLSAQSVLSFVVKKDGVISKGDLKTDTLDVENGGAVKGDFIVENVKVVDDAAAVDEKTWLVDNDAGTLTVSAESDDGTTTNPAMTIKRTGIAIDSVEFSSEVSGAIAPTDAAHLTRKDYVDSMVRHRNLLINGGFDVWQRGTSFSPVTGDFFADRWRARHPNHTGGTTSISAIGLNYYARMYAKIDVSGHTSDFYIGQNVENIPAFHNKKLTLSMRIDHDSEVPWNARIYIEHTGGRTDLQSKLLIGDRRNLEVTLDAMDLSAYTVDKNSYIGVDIASTAALPDGSYRFYEIQLEEGSVATEFDRVPLTTTEMLCYRYTQKLSSDSVPEVDLRPRMRATPTIVAITGGYLYDAEIL